MPSVRSALTRDYFAALWENVGFMCAIMSVFLALTYIFLRFLGHPRFRYV